MKKQIPSHLILPQDKCLIFYQIGYMEIKVSLGISKLARRKNATGCATVAFAINDPNFWNLKF